jgi:hypothetical protein
MSLKNFLRKNDVGSAALPSKAHAFADPGTCAEKPRYCVFQTGAVSADNRIGT